MTQPVETVAPFFRTGDYAPVTDELTAFDLPVGGAIPPELNGWYLRNGPNPRQATGHWFTGDGMIHGVRHRGRPRRLVPQPLGAHRQLREPDSRSTTPTAPATCVPASPTPTSCNHAGKTLALVESSLPYEITNDLETAGCLRLRRQAGRLDDRPSEDLPDHRRVALLRLRQPLRVRM